MKALGHPQGAAPPADDDPGGLWERQARIKQYKQKSKALFLLSSDNNRLRLEKQLN